MVRNEAELDVARLVGLIRPLAETRRNNASGARHDRDLTNRLKDYLSTLPEGERELWDLEREPHVGVALVNEGGTRWVDLSALSDVIVLWAARIGLLRLAPEGYDAVKTLADAGSLNIEYRENLSQFARAVHQGGAAGAGKLVILPRRGEQ